MRKLRLRSFSKSTAHTHRGTNDTGPSSDLWIQRLANPSVKVATLGSRSTRLEQVHTSSWHRQGCSHSPTLGQAAGGSDLSAIDCAASSLDGSENDYPTGTGDSTMISLDPLTLQDYKRGGGH